MRGLHGQQPAGTGAGTRPDDRADADIRDCTLRVGPEWGQGGARVGPGSNAIPPHAWFNDEERFTRRTRREAAEHEYNHEAGITTMPASVIVITLRGLSSRLRASA
jgi:hypothetical protein